MPDSKKAWVNTESTTTTTIWVQWNTLTHSFMASTNGHDDGTHVDSMFLRLTLHLHVNWSSPLQKENQRIYLPDLDLANKSLHSPMLHLAFSDEVHPVRLSTFSILQFGDSTSINIHPADTQREMLCVYVGLTQFYPVWTHDGTCAPLDMEPPAHVAHSQIRHGSLEKGPTGANKDRNPSHVVVSCV